MSGCRLSRPRLNKTVDYMVGVIVSFGVSAPLASFFCLLDMVRHLDHKISIGEVGVLSPNFRHSFVGCIFDFLFVPVFYIIVQRTFSMCNLAKVFVVCHVFGTDITAFVLACTIQNTTIRPETYHCKFRQWEHDILLHP